MNENARFEEIQKMYGVPAALGGRVRLFDSFGTIVGTRNNSLMVKFERSPQPLECHPTWHLEYIEEVNNGESSVSTSEDSPLFEDCTRRSVG